jgi:hypothetical protein
VDAKGSSIDIKKQENSMTILMQLSYLRRERCDKKNSESQSLTVLKEFLNLLIKNSKHDVYLSNERLAN